jgi:hypothetical protein
LTSLVNYRKTGRAVIAGYAWYKFGQAVGQGSLLGATSWGYVAVEATIGFFVPDPVAVAIGAGTVRSGAWLLSKWTKFLLWTLRNPAKFGLAIFILTMPWGIRERQELKASRGQIEPIGIASFEAEKIPGTERLRVPSIVGGRVF